MMPTSIRRGLSPWLAVIGVQLVFVPVGIAHPPANLSRLFLAPCHVAGVNEELRCGELLVPEDRSRPHDRQVKLHFLILPALDGSADAPVLFDLPGGPAITETASVGFWTTAGRIHRKHRRIVLVDQRGTGDSHPLRCPQLEFAGTLDEIYPADVVARCRQSLAQDADLQDYVTTEAIADLEDVRDALVVSKVDLSGLSYGSRTAQVYLRMHPEHVRSVVLMGTLPMDREAPLEHARNSQAVLERVFDECAADRACSHAFPRLRTEWAEILTRLDRAPVRVAAVIDGQTATQLFRRGPFGEAFRSLLYTTSGQRAVPYLIDRAAHGDFEPFLRRFSKVEGAFAEGLYLSIECGEDPMPSQIAIARATRGTFLGNYRATRQATACRLWGVHPVPLSFHVPVKSAVPVLLLAGGMDAVTPINWARDVSAHLPNSRVIVFDDLGHFPDGLTSMECYDAIAEEFLVRGSANSLDLSCKSSMHAPPFQLVERKTAP
jgi:pimeloyl-ACP methyl ester carboxylesterase